LAKATEDFQRSRKGILVGMSQEQSRTGYPGEGLERQMLGTTCNNQQGIGRLATPVNHPMGQVAGCQVCGESRHCGANLVRRMKAGGEGENLQHAQPLMTTFWT